MGFMGGRVTYVRYRVGGGSPLPMGDALMERVAAHAIGRHGVEAQDGISVGWAAGDHVLDLNFDPAKNLVNDALHLGMRIDTDKIPGDLLRAYTKIEVDARAHLNPTGFANKAQKQEAKEAAVARAEAEAKDGRFRRRKLTPVLWDGRANVLYAGTNSASVLDRLLGLFRETFDRTLEPITAGSLALEQAEARGSSRPVEDAGPVLYLGEGGHTSVAWTGADASSRDYWGNEFLIWLWHTLQHDSDTLALSDGSEATVMVAKTLTLDCPRGETGRDSLTNEGPTRLPEALRALQSGKLPRRAGLIVVREGSQYELTLQAETLSVSGAALPKIEGARGPELQFARVDSLRHLVETLDLIFEAYGRHRTGMDWSGVLGRIRNWMKVA